jgi:hypothetical protein
MTFKQFLESKKNDTTRVDAVMDIAKALQKVFKDYTLITRREAWKKIHGAKGEKLIQDLLTTPSQTLSPFRSIAY